MRMGRISLREDCIALSHDDACILPSTIIRLALAAQQFLMPLQLFLLQRPPLLFLIPPPIAEWLKH